MTIGNSVRFGRSAPAFATPTGKFERVGDQSLRHKIKGGKGKKCRTQGRIEP